MITEREQGKAYLSITFQDGSEHTITVKSDLSLGVDAARLVRAHNVTKVVARTADGYFFTVVSGAN